MDDIKRLIEKYKQELMEYSRAAPKPRQDFLNMQEMIHSAEGFVYQPENDEAEEQPRTSADSAERIEWSSTVPAEDNSDISEQLWESRVREEIEQPTDNEQSAANSGAPAEEASLFREAAPDYETAPAEASQNPEQESAAEAEIPAEPEKPLIAWSQEEAEEPAPTEETAEPRRPQVIGYVDKENEEVIAEYNNLIADMLPNTSTVPSFAEVREEITETSVPEQNIPVENPSGVTQNGGVEPRPDIPAPDTVSNETAERLTEQPISGVYPEEQLTGRHFADQTPTENDPADIKPLENEGQPFEGYEEQLFDSYEDFLAQNTSRGQMRFFIYTAREALPVVGARCLILKKLGGEMKTLHELYTDRSGQTVIVPLPAPPKELSQTAGSPIQPYSLYDAEISAKGYATVKLSNIPVFAGVLSLQRTAMIPEANGVEEIIDEQTKNNGGV